MEMIKFKTENEAIDYLEKISKEYKKITIEEYFTSAILVFVKDDFYQVYFTSETDIPFEVHDYLLKDKNIEDIFDKIIEIRKIKDEYRKNVKEDYLETLKKIRSNYL